MDTYRVLKNNFIKRGGRGKTRDEEYKSCLTRFVFDLFLLSNRELKLSDSFRRGPHLYFDVVAESIQTVHQFTFGKIRKLSTQ